MAEDGSIQSSFAADEDAPQSPLFDEEADSDNSGNNNNDDSTKQRQASSGTAIGATQVNERAVNLYTRQYRGRNRVSQRIRARQERAARREAAAAMAAANNNDEEMGTNNTQSENEDRRASLTQMVRASVRTVSQRRASVDTVVTATLVEDAEIVMATEMGFCERNWKRIVAIMVVVLAILALLLGLFVNRYESIIQEQVEPTASPTFDSTPTLQTVQERGFIRCGMNYKLTNDTENFRQLLCRAVAAVVVGDANSYELVPITLASRWDVLKNHKADLLIGADTHTIQREIGRGLTFSTPYNYDGIAYAGNKTYRECAEARQRYGVCSSLSICVLTDSTSFEFVSALFPRMYYIGCSSMDEMRLLMANETCNVAASELTILLSFGLSKYGVGDTLFTKEPHAFVTRNNDREFSDVVNWVLHALFFGEEQGLRQNATECNSTKVTPVAAELNYLDAVYCVGSYAELYDFPDHRGMNSINNGTKMLFATPFGDLDFAINKDPDLAGFGPQPDSTFAEIMNNGILNCGVVDLNESEGVVGMSTDYCRTLAAAIFYGNYEAVNLLNFSSTDEAYLALQNGTVDVLTGTVVNKARDFGGNDFSTPYYYESGTGRESLIAYAFATREDDVLFTSFVNCAVLATIYAEERGRNQVPLASIFGEDLRWSLRDAVSYSNSYDDLYSKHFGLDSDRGRNELNRMVESTPQLHSLPFVKLHLGVVD